MSEYANINYDQFKELSDEQKSEALKELEKRFPDRKDLAEYLGIRGNVLGILYSKYIDGKKLGRQKVETNNSVIEDIKIETTKEEIPEQKHIEEIKPVEYTPLQLVTPNQPVKTIEPKNENDEGYSVNLNKQVNGEEAISRITRIANSLLEDKRYNINIVIKELDT